MREAYDNLYVYTMDRPGFILQHVVDAYGAQTATAETKPIAVIFSLAGLYLRVEKSRDGRFVQREHARLAKLGLKWPSIELPRERGLLTAADVMAALPGEERDAAIDRWCESVWEAYRESRPAIEMILKRA